MTKEDEKYMRRCFQLAKMGLGYTAPNPMVGAVIVHNGRIIGEGYHRQWGGPHAEVNAVNSVREEDRPLLEESTIYVSLEPCSHWGKTPPCAQLLIDKKIPHVVVACGDPFPEVAGRGLQMLRDAGAIVETGVLEEEGWELNRRFFTFHTQKRPYIILKWAQTSNGYMGTAEGKSIKISTPESSALVHQLRAQESGILVGTNTAVGDNPSLTVRDYFGKQPLRIAIDRHLRIPDCHHLLDGSVPTLIFCEELPTGTKENVNYVKAPFNAEGIDLQFVLTELYNQKVQSLIVEGGSSLLQSFIDKGLYDEMRVETNTTLSVENGIKAPNAHGLVVEQFAVGNNTIIRYRNK
ncbi:MAG: bifunctional diaminohydroxyphosphoribosylaminopyrimidine deaminase/5-amino-6-(5-phosphoribosylamino)uracil reductase RibD [Paludibacteraceae bacterium]|nr:bifunctional diaminohydroxyphosphoribosylaminopyrimidine deaminase/5-amino-6-(5-phosphoribosylamino)uracil reductase RibD [Paludibacteraceae bacterium]